MPLPSLGAGEVLVRTRLTAVSLGSERSVVEGFGPFPMLLGYQTLGVVEARGPGVTLPVGQRVVTTLGHASAGVHRAERVIPVPERVADRVALTVILGEETAKGLRKVRPEVSERVLIAGAGLLGLLSLFNLTRRGVHDVTVLEPDAERRALALTFGAKAAFAPGELPHDAFDVGVECSASPAGFAELLGHLRPGGRAVVLSDGNWGALTLPREFHSRELTVTASSDGEDYAAYATWLWEHADGRLAELFPVTLTREQLPRAFRKWRQWPRPVSAVVEWNG
ncbi:theronine dehydrogenase [Deinococcus sp. MIMF12]|uniref:Theronine dehydrogenase n=1 Tax=Deinococcus rhizophilus TaxID=3049544 RepID=A0ABT7JJN9_9DEIO|nr:zinc-binding dehydrogenase [Deinococcus rhizophilus]MDL2344690.1 theronine dehydrogenase [Deinococcus rhizophilus]